MTARRLTPLVALALLFACTPAAQAQNTGGAEYSESAFSAAPPDVLLGNTVSFSGSAPAGRDVLIERFDREYGWVAEQFATADSRGRFTATWQPTESGRFDVRAVVRGNDAASAASSPEPIEVTIYKPAIATWFGPGFYGNRTACGKKMTRRLMGVAHKKLKCGTKVALYYQGRTVTVPVVDRGPFRKNTRWDLTYATAKALDFQHTDEIGAVRLRRR